MAAFAAAGCSKSEYHIYEQVGSTLLFTNGGYIDMSADYENTPSFEVCVYRSGTETAAVQAGIEMKKGALLAYNIANGCNFKLLPEGCYSLESGLKTMAEKEKILKFDVSFDAGFTGALPSGEYALPVSIISPDARTQKGKDVIIIAIRIN